MWRSMFLLALALLVLIGPSLALDATPVPDNVIDRDPVISQQEDVVIDVEDAVQEQLHIDSDSVCEFVDLVDADTVDDSVPRYLDMDINAACHDDSQEDGVLGECWCPEGMMCDYEGTTDALMQYYCIAIPTDEEEEFGDGLMLGENEEPVVSIIDE